VREGRDLWHGGVIAFNLRAKKVIGALTAPLRQRANGASVGGVRHIDRRGPREAAWGTF
jgi:hypothetical protein